ncbi:MAG TPA: hypothetical protein VN843_01320, partial [Anaerolineales bacterium]|nr:hypothetical protein [Anaerolineales bacterium]
MQGRLTGGDPGPLTPADPQSFNKYSYVQNNPLKFIDPTGRELTFIGADADYIVSEFRIGRFDESHYEGLYFESQVLSDYTGWSEKPAERRRVDTPEGRVVHV